MWSSCIFLDICMSVYPANAVLLHNDVMKVNKLSLVRYTKWSKLQTTSTGPQQSQVDHHHHHLLINLSISGWFVMSCITFVIDACYKCKEKGALTT